MNAFQPHANITPLVLTQSPPTHVPAIQDSPVTTPFTCTHQYHAFYKTYLFLIVDAIKSYRKFIEIINSFIIINFVINSVYILKLRYKTIYL